MSRACDRHGVWWPRMEWTETDGDGPDEVQRGMRGAQLIERALRAELGDVLYVRECGASWRDVSPVPIKGAVRPVVDDHAAVRAHLAERVQLPAEARVGDRYAHARRAGDGER